jgi:hypothetical protein
MLLNSTMKDELFHINKAKIYIFLILVDYKYILTNYMFYFYIIYYVNLFLIFIDRMKNNHIVFDLNYIIIVSVSL